MAEAPHSGGISRRDPDRVGAVAGSGKTPGELSTIAPAITTSAFRGASMWGTESVLAIVGEVGHPTGDVTAG